MKKIIFRHFSALVVQMHVHINMYIQITPAEPDKKTTTRVTIPSGGCSFSAIPAAEANPQIKMAAHVKAAI